MAMGGGNIDTKATKDGEGNEGAETKARLDSTFSIL
jgi:hypothetical protein